MGIAVETVENRRDWREFLELPFRIYRGDPHWVPPLGSEVKRTLDVGRNPFFADAERRLFICRRDGVTVARVAVIVNRRHWRTFADRPAFFGFFESEPDQEAVAALFEAASGYAEEVGAERLEGPFNPHHYGEMGLQLSGFDRPTTFFQTHNPPSYRMLLESNGCQLVKLIHTRRNGRIREHLGRMRHPASNDGRKNGFVCRPFDKRRFDEELETVRVISNDAFQRNWHFVPLSHEEYTFSAKYLTLVTSPELFQIVEYRGEPVGVIECIPDVNPFLREMGGRSGPVRALRFLRNRRRATTLVVYAVGIRGAYQGTRVFVELFNALRRMASGYEALETTWISDDNRLIVRASEYFGLERDKEFGIFSRPIAKGAPS